VTLDQAGVQTNGRDAAVTALGALVQLAAATVSGVMLIAQQKEEPPEISQLVPTERALPVLSEVVRTSVAILTDCEIIDYGPATSTADGQVMWIPVATAPLLKAIVDESADLAGMPLFDPAKAKLSNLQLAAMRAKANDSSAVFNHLGLYAEQIG
jgi:hypothetical protein